MLSAREMLARIDAGEGTMPGEVLASIAGENMTPLSPHGGATAA